MRKYISHCCVFFFLSLFSLQPLFGNEENVQSNIHHGNSTFSKVNQLIKDRQYDEALHQLNDYIHSSPPNAKKRLD